MNKLLTLIFMSSFAYADMNKVCDITIGATANWKQVEDYIYKGDCKKDNILYVNSFQNIPDKALVEISSLWCRYDRNTVIKENSLSCVLHSSKKRKRIVTFLK